MYFMFVEWIENLIAWCKKQGGIAYWIWMGAIAITGLVAGMIFGRYGFVSETRKWLAVALIVYIVPVPLVYYFEKKRRV